MSDPAPNPIPTSDPPSSIPLSTIIITLDYSDGYPVPVIDIGDLDIWSVASILQACKDRVWEWMPEARFSDDEDEEGED